MRSMLKKTVIEKELKRLIVDKYMGLFLCFFTLISAFFVPQGDWAFRFMSFFMITIGFLSGCMMYFPYYVTRDNLITNSKIDLSIYFLLKVTDHQISPEHCLQVIKNTNIALNFKFIPNYEEFKELNYLEALRMHVFERYALISYPMIDPDLFFVNHYLPSVESYLSLEEKDLLRNKLSFYSY